MCVKRRAILNDCCLMAGRAAPFVTYNKFIVLAVTVNQTKETQDELARI